MNPEDPSLAVLRGHLPEIFLGPVFLFVGVCACSVAAIRRRGEFRVLLWFGLFIGMYGVRILAEATTVLALAPSSPWPRHLRVIVDFLLVVPGLLFWVELSLGKLRQLILLLAILGASVGILGLGWYFATGSPYKFLIYNNVFAICMLLAVGVVIVVPGLSRKYLVIQSPVLSIALLAIAVVALYVNSSGFLHYRPVPYAEPIAFAAWVLALGYVAVERTFENERRLLSIDNELETARQIQFSILPERTPSVSKLRIAAAYHPMSAVAGDFYQFIQVDQDRLGVLVADVSGHGVPAALISSMLKVAMQSVAAYADDPAQVLRRLNQILSPELRGQLISAAYLWIDTENQRARYSAAGHPPLLCWKNARGELERIESNGLLFGVAPESDYPVCSISINPGDRFLLYTDGMVEPENADGQAFGERQLERVVRDHRSQPAGTFVQEVFSELRRWPPASAAQQDDITLIVIDVL